MLTTHMANYRNRVMVVVEGQAPLCEGGGKVRQGTHNHTYISRDIPGEVCNDKSGF